MDIFFSQRRHTDCQQECEKLLNITNNQGNAHQNHNELSLPIRKAIIKEARSKCLQGCEGKGTLVCCWWKCKFPIVQPL